MKNVVSALLLAAVAGSAHGQGLVEAALYGGSYTIDLANGQYTDRVATINYDSTNFATSGAPGFGVGGTSSTALNTVYGDAISMVGASGGTLDSFKFAVFCSSSSAANLTSATETISFYRASNSTLIGSFNVTLGALAKGFYSVYTVTSLSALNINFDTNDVIVTQQLSNVVGATRMGTVFSNASNTPAVGTTTPGMYIANATTTAGFYTFTGFASFSSAVYQVSTIPAPGALAMLGLAGVAAGRRRR